MSDQVKAAIRARAEAEGDTETLKHMDQQAEQRALVASREEALKLARKVDLASGREQTEAVQELRDVLEPVATLPLANQVERMPTSLCSGQIAQTGSSACFPCWTAGPVLQSPSPWRQTTPYNGTGSFPDGFQQAG